MPGKEGKVEKVGKSEKDALNRRVQKWSNMVQNNSKLVQNDLQELKKIQYCSKCSEFVFKKSSKWVRHNQVSWSSSGLRQKVYCLLRIQKGYPKHDIGHKIYQI